VLESLGLLDKECSAEEDNGVQGRSPQRTGERLVRGKAAVRVERHTGEERRETDGETNDGSMISDFCKAVTWEKDLVFRCHRITSILSNPVIPMVMKSEYFTTVMA
jgi:hypothetical protein